LSQSISPLVISLSDFIFHCGGVGNDQTNRLARKSTLKSTKLAIYSIKILFSIYIFIKGPLINNMQICLTFFTCDGHNYYDLSQNNIKWEFRYSYSVILRSYKYSLQFHNNDPKTSPHHSLSLWNVHVTKFKKSKIVFRLYITRIARTIC
jgi:hypothetical protein